MRKPRTGEGVTVAEVAAILTKLLGTAITTAQVRSVLVLDTRGRTMSPRRHGQTRLYSAVDVALVRLVLRLRAEGVSPTVARVVVAHFRELLAQHWTHHDPMAFAVIGMRGLLLYAKQSRPDGAVAWMDLRDVWRGVERAVQAVRQKAPEVWQWKSQPASAVGEGA
jgi:DNA-binding transcriptional MerR regulator